MKQRYVMAIIIFCYALPLILGGIQCVFEKNRFIRYKINHFFELEDYFRGNIIENHIFRHNIKNNYLYTYGVTGYTKVYLGLRSDITKIINSKYDENFLHEQDLRYNLYSNIKELKAKYGYNLSIKNNFKEISDNDLEIFMKLYKKEMRYKHDYQYSIVDNDLLYKNGKEVLQGLDELNLDLVTIYNQRFSNKANK